MSILDTITNEDKCVELVHEYFAGKYSVEDIRTLLYQFNPFGGLTVRRGVQKLSEEWHKLKNYDEDTINDWYKETDFYVFDLLPWNACEMFTAKMDAIVPILKNQEVKTLVDYGGGLGISSFLIKEKCPDIDILYCDFRQSHQYKFCKFLMDKLSITGIGMVDVNEFLDVGVPQSYTHYDAILAMDCFEHIPNLGGVIKKLGCHTNMIIHDSTFHRNEAQPQHVNDKGEVWFINLMLENNFFMPEGDFRVFRKFKMVLQNNSLAMAFYNVEDDIYK